MEQATWPNQQIRPDEGSQRLPNRLIHVDRVCPVIGYERLRPVLDLKGRQ